MSEYIYMIQEREFINADKPIYKIGGTTQENGIKMGSKIKKAKLFLQIVCVDSKLTEKKIFKLFREKYIWKKKLGRKYFEGNYMEMIADIHNILQGIEEVYSDEDISDISSEISQNNSNDAPSIDEDFDNRSENSDMMDIDDSDGSPIPRRKPKILDLVSGSDDSSESDDSSDESDDSDYPKNKGRNYESDEDFPLYTSRGSYYHGKKRRR